MASRIKDEPVWEYIDFKESFWFLEHGVPHERIHWHVHEQYELHLITVTCGKVMIGNYIGPFAPGHLTLVGPWMPHNWESNLAPGERHELRDLVIQFNPELIPNALRVFPELVALKGMLEQAKMGIEFTDVPFSESKEKFLEIRKASGMDRLLKFLAFLNQLSTKSTRVLSSLPASEVKDPDSLQGKVNVVVEYVMDNFHHPIRLKTVADLLEMKETYFSRFFHHATGHRFTDFVNRVRIQRACVLLNETDDAIAEISHQVGFNNFANFSRQFRRIRGISPQAYRKTHAN